MSEFLKMDVFFFVSTVAVLIMALSVCYLLWRIHKILKHVEHISEQVSLESDIVREDLRDLRQNIRQGKGKIKSLFIFIKNLIRNS